MKDKRSNSVLDAELHISPKPVLIALGILGPVLYFAGEILSYPYESLKAYIPFTFLLWILTTAGWLLFRWQPWAGRWFTVVALVAVVCLGNVWLSISGVHVFLVIPTALAAALIGPLASVAAAAGQSALLLFSPRTVVVAPDFATITMALMVIWATVGAMYAVYRPVYQLNGWLSGYFERTQQALAEAQERRAELEQTRDAWTHANRQLILANERLTALRLIAEQAQKSKAWFVARVSHEFRAPLNMIIGLVGIMVEKPETYAEELPPDLWADLEIVYRNCKHLSSMINDVLDLTQAESGRLALQRQQNDLGEIIESALAVVRPLAEKRRLHLQVSIPDDLPKIYCDRTRIRQVILNLVSNAASFTIKGGIKVHVEQQEQRVVVGVTDTGSGITPEDVERIFEPFYRGLRQRPDDGGGSGLGLSISKQFVALHGGQMWAESELGLGSTFFFTLPVSRPSELVARPGHWIKEDWQWREHAFKSVRAAFASQLGKPRVVVCDEMGDLCLELARHSDQVEFIDARSLTRARQEVEECPAHAIVLNVPIPDGLVSSVDMARREIPGTPIIGCCVPRSAGRALEAGALGHLIKPVTHIDLEKSIQAVGGTVRRVLVVDDDPSILQLLTRLLRACDGKLEITTASSGQQALDQLRKSPPDLMLLDVMMPDMNGWQILEAIRQDGSIGKLPVFVVSAQDPGDQPLASRFFVAAMDEGLSISKLLRGLLQFSALMLEPDQETDRAPE
jgi:signal transduction histidine kinase/CheY-like chemotaxis protein